MPDRRHPAAGPAFSRTAGFSRPCSALAGPELDRWQEEAHEGELGGRPQLAVGPVADIEDLRDRRIELLESQIKVTELYLNNLRKRLVGLQAEASAFKPYTTNADAPQIPENLALDISRTAASINLYEQRLSQTRSDQAALRVSFNNDISRFRELKGG